MRWRKVKQQQKIGKKEKSDKKAAVHYAPFRLRLLAFMTDLFMIGLPVSLIIMMIFGHDAMQGVSALDVLAKENVTPPNPMISITQLILSMIAYVGLWAYSGETPGKKMLHLKVVDAKSFQTGNIFQLTIRFFGYFISFITLVGFFIGLFRKDGRALHDLLSRTAVIYQSE